MPSAMIHISVNNLRSRFKKNLRNQRAETTRLAFAKVIGITTALARYIRAATDIGRVIGAVTSDPQSSVIVITDGLTHAQAIVCLEKRRY